MVFLSTPCRRSLPALLPPACALSSAMPLPWRQPAVEAASPGSPRAAKALTSSGLARRWEHLKPDPGHVTDPSRIGFERLPFHAGAWGGGLAGCMWGGGESLCGCCKVCVLGMPRCGEQLQQQHSMCLWLQCITAEGWCDCECKHQYG
jgi:hypothetical protein